MRAHHDDVVPTDLIEPTDLLESGMARTTRAVAAAERDVTSAHAEVTDVEELLEQALRIAGGCWLHHQAAPPFVRRQVDQGFFEELWIGLDGQVERAEPTAPFAALQSRTISPTTSATTKAHPPVTGSGLMGSHNDALVALTGPRSRLNRLISLANLPIGTRRGATAGGPRQTQRRLLDAQVFAMAAAYQTGADLKQLAKTFGVHRHTAAAHLRRLAIPLRRQGIDERDIPEVVKTVYGARLATGQTRREVRVRRRDGAADTQAQRSQATRTLGRC